MPWPKPCIATWSTYYGRKTEVAIGGMVDVRGGVRVGREAKL